jgi:NAD-dependent deacetylase
MKQSLVILTGAGISAESGLRTFRDNDGLWCDHRIEDVATPQAFVRNPRLVQEFYNQRRAQLKEAAPNAAHIALAELAEKWPGNLLLVTQNVDDLHDRSLTGRKLPKGFELVHMHGELKKARCAETDTVYDWEENITTETLCACCSEPGTMRPHIVWFGEMPLQMPEISHALQHCDLFVSIGTSGNVYPAAGFVQEAKMNGHAKTVELNLEPSAGYSLFDEKIYGPATKTVPDFVQKILATG